MNMEIGTEAEQFIFWNICFEFSARIVSWHCTFQLSLIKISCYYLSNNKIFCFLPGVLMQAHAHALAYAKCVDPLADGWDTAPQNASLSARGAVQLHDNRRAVQRTLAVRRTQAVRRRKAAPPGTEKAGEPPENTGRTVARAGETVG